MIHGAEGTAPSALVRCLPSLVRHDAEGRTPLDLVTAEKSRVRQPWDPAPKLAKYDAVIAMLTQVGRWGCVKKIHIQPRN